MPHRAFIVSVARTAAGKRNGRISHLHPASLGARVVDHLLAKHPQMDPAHVDDVIFGCVSQVGMQAANLGRNVVLASNTLPLTVPGTTVDRQCGSSQQAIHFAAQAVMSGTQDIVIAGGAESMSQVPLMANMPKGGLGVPNSPECQARHGEGGFYSQFVGAERVCSEFGVSRQAMDEFAAASHAKAAAAQQAGRFAGEVVPIADGRNPKTGEGVMHDVDEGVRPGTTVEKLAALDTLVAQGFVSGQSDAPEGRITAGNASQISDGAAAVLIANEAGLKKLSASPLAEIHTLSLAGADPVTMLAAPIPATARALERAGLTIDDIDLYEVNEAFACVPLAWLLATGASPAKLNVNGGACSLGHPLGGTGAKLMTTLVSELVRRGGTYGLQAICEGGGTANCTIIKRC